MCSSTTSNRRVPAAARVTSSLPSSWASPTSCCSISVFLITRRHLFPRGRRQRVCVVVDPLSLHRPVRLPSCLCLRALGTSSGAVGRMCRLWLQFFCCLRSKYAFVFCVFCTAVPRCTGGGRMCPPVRDCVLPLVLQGEGLLHPQVPGSGSHF